MKLAEKKKSSLSPPDSLPFVSPVGPVPIGCGHMLRYLLALWLRLCSEGIHSMVMEHTKKGLQGERDGEGVFAILKFNIVFLYQKKKLAWPRR